MSFLNTKNHGSFVGHVPWNYARAWPTIVISCFLNSLESTPAHKSQLLLVHPLLLPLLFSFSKKQMNFSSWEFPRMVMSTFLLCIWDSVCFSASVYKEWDCMEWVGVSSGAQDTKKPWSWAQERASSPCNLSPPMCPRVRGALTGSLDREGLPLESNINVF